jgi:hypothetical protein
MLILSEGKIVNQHYQPNLAAGLEVDQDQIKDRGH